MYDIHDPSRGCLCGCTACFLSRAQWLREQEAQRLAIDHYLSGDLDRIGAYRRYEIGE